MNLLKVEMAVYVVYPENCPSAAFAYAALDDYFQVLKIHSSHRNGLTLHACYITGEPRRWILNHLAHVIDSLLTPAPIKA